MIEYTQLTLHGNRDYGALNRLLGLIRQRCFEIENMLVHPESKTSYRIQVVVYSERNVSHLLKKINQMVEVQSLAACKLMPVHEDHMRNLPALGATSSSLAQPAVATS